MQATNSKLWNKNFTMVVIGQIISLFGNTILRFALNVYVLELTGSAAIFGTVSALSIIPSVLLSPLGGILSDRVNKRNIMVVLDFATAGLIILFSLLFRLENAVPLVAVLLMVLAAIQAFYGPSVQSSVPLLQSGSNVVRGNAVVNQVSMLANLLGPILGGALYGLFGVLPLVWVGAACFFASAVLELFIHIPFVKQRSRGGAFKTIWYDFKEGGRFITKEQPDMMRLMLVLMLVNLLVSSMMSVGRSYMILSVLGISSEWYGVSSSFMGAGGLLGGLLAGALAGRLPAKRYALVLALLAPVLLPIPFAFMLNLPNMVVFWVITVSGLLFSALASVFNINAVSLMQQGTPSHLLGKVFAYVSAVAMAAQPVGHALYGLLFDTFSTNIAVVMIPTILATALLAAMVHKPFVRLESVGRAAPQPAAEQTGSMA